MPFDIHQHQPHDTFEPRKHSDQELLALNIPSVYFDGCEDYFAEAQKCRMTLLQQKGVIRTKKLWKDHCFYYWNHWMKCREVKHTEIGLVSGSIL